MSNIFLSIKTETQSLFLGVILYSTAAADVLASSLLDLKKVNIESSIFIIEFENLTVSYFWLL